MPRFQRSLMTLVALVASVALTTSALSSCSSFGRERHCNGGERLVRDVNGGNGRICIKNGTPPPPGMEDYPTGETPTYVDEGK